MQLTDLHSLDNVHSLDNDKADALKAGQIEDCTSHCGKYLTIIKFGTLQEVPDFDLGMRELWLGTAQTIGTKMDYFSKKGGGWHQGLDVANSHREAWGCGSYGSAAGLEADMPDFPGRKKAVKKEALDYPP